MRIIKLSTSLSWLVTLALLLNTFLSIITISAASSPVIVLSQTSGEAGSSITVSGYDFTPNYYYYIFVAQHSMLGQGTIDSSGAFSRSITINITTPGQYEVMVFASATRQSPNYNRDFDQGAVAFFTVIPTPDPAIVVTPSTGKPGTSTIISGKYFTQSYNFYLFFNGTYLLKGTVDNGGLFSQSITIPAALNIGSYDVTAVASKINDTSPSISKTYDETATTYFTVVYKIPKVSLDNNTGKVADTFILSGSDFSAGDTITVYWDGTQIGSIFFPTTSNTFEGKSFTVPETYYGSHTIKVANTTDSYSLSYTVIPDLTLSATSLISGDQIIVSGKGFNASSDVTFYIDNTTVTAKSTTTAKGTFSDTIIAISNVTTGSHDVKAQDSAGNSAAEEINVSMPQPTTTSATTTVTPAASPSATTPANSTSTAIQPSTTPASPTQSQTPTKTSTSTQPQPAPKSSTFPIWGIIVIAIIAVFVIVVVVMVVICRRKSYH